MTEATPCWWCQCFVYLSFSFSLSLSTFQDSQHHVPVFHARPVERHGAVGAQREAAGQRGDQVEGLGQPLPRQLPGLRDGGEAGLERLLLGGGRGRGFDGRGRGSSASECVGRVEGGVGAGHVQGDALMLQDVDAGRSCEQSKEPLVALMDGGQKQKQSLWTGSVEIWTYGRNKCNYRMTCILHVC